MPQHDTALVSPTGRIHLAPPNAADDESVSILRSHPETRRYLRFWPEAVTAEDVRKKREERAEDDRIADFYIHVQNILTPDSKREFAGICGIFDIDTLMRSCCIGIAISPAYYQMGIGTETLYTLMRYTFEDRGLHRGVYETGVDNVAMRRWLEDVAGVKQEFRLREAWVDGERWIDVAGYSVLEWEWMGGVKDRLEKRLSKRR